MTTIDFDRNRLLRQALEPGPACPPLAELLDTQFAGAQTPAAEALRAHAAGCPACAAELALAAAADAAPHSTAEAQEIAWVAQRLTTPQPASRIEPKAPAGRVLPMAPKIAARAKRAKASGGQGELSLWSRWAAAALVVIGLGLVFEWGHRSFAPALPGAADALRSDVVRSGEVLLDAPAGVVTSRLTGFSWRAVDGAASYRLEVRDVAGDLLWQGNVASPRLAAPAELETKLESFVTYRWSVVALDVAGSPVAQSAIVSFRLEPAD